MFRLLIIICTAFLFFLSCTSDDADVDSCINAFDCADGQVCIDGKCVNSTGDTGITDDSGDTGNTGNTGTTNDSGNTGENDNDSGDINDGGDAGDEDNTGDDSNTGDDDDTGDTGNVKENQPCTGLPENAVWNTASSITQTWDGSEWVPDTTGVYDTTESSTECHFKCAVNYSWNDTECVADTKIFTCDPKPDIATLWNEVSEYSQTWDGSAWSPADSETAYNDTADTQSCRYKCYDLYAWDGSNCVAEGSCSDGIVQNDRILFSGNAVVHFPFDESTGEIATDITGNGNNGTIEGNPARVTGRYGNAISFDGIDDSVSWNYSGGRPTDNFTMMAWVKTSTAITLYTEADSGTNGVSGQQYVFYPEHGGEECPASGAGFSVGTNGITVVEHCGSYAPPIAVYGGNIGTEWNHIAVTYTDKQPKIYLNGKLVRTGLTSSKPYVNAPAMSGYGWTFFSGEIDDIRVFDYPLSENEIRSFVTGPVMALSMDETSGNVTFDSSGSGNNGTLYNEPSRVAGQKGNGFSFNGTGEQYINIENDSSLQITGDQTITLWLKPADFAQRTNPFHKSYGGEGSIAVETDGTVTYSYGTAGADGDPHGDYSMTDPLSLNEWTHLAVVREISGTDKKVRWYKNGVLINEYAAQHDTAAASALPVKIGNGYTGHTFNGIIDEVMVYNRALSGSEIVLNTFELCDGTTGVNSCSSVNPLFSDGTISCNDTCGYDFSNCTYCGDGIVNGFEQCDKALTYTVDGLCTGEYGVHTFYGTSTAGCSDECVKNLDCQFCGDGVIQTASGEVCDGTNLNGQTCVTELTFNSNGSGSTGTIQTWTVPYTGTYRITAYGAQGAHADGGLGAKMAGDFYLEKDTVIKILVGQRGTATSDTHIGGGGGSFVVKNGATDSSGILVIAGGGGGANSTSSSYDNRHASISTSGNSGKGQDNGSGGTNGTGGEGDTRGPGGGGFLTSGENAGSYSKGGISYLLGGAGGVGVDSGDGSGTGGFGGGGGPGGTGNFKYSGGGGGYSGGGGGGDAGSNCGGGGGSFNAGTNQDNVTKARSGNGLVVISGGNLTCNSDCKSFNYSQCLQ